MEDKNQKLERCFKAGLYEFIGLMTGFFASYLLIIGIVSIPLLALGLALQLYGLKVLWQKK